MKVVLKFLYWICIENELDKLILVTDQNEASLPKNLADLWTYSLLSFQITWEGSLNEEEWLIRVAVLDFAN